MSVTTACEARVFSAGGHCFAWAEMIESARARAQWAALQHRVLGLLARARAGRHRALRRCKAPPTTSATDESCCPVTNSTNASADTTCAAQLQEPVLAAQIADNQVDWTRLDLLCLIHRDEVVVREAALCVRLDGRELADVAADAEAELREMGLLLDDAEPRLCTRLLAASTGELIGPLATEGGHQLVLVLRRMAPSLDDAMVHRRAEETLIERALAAEVNRHVNWHEHL